MAIPASIRSLLSGREVEWARIEFKTTWDPAASLKTICAFANDLDNWGGGYIVIGVEEKNGIPQRPLIGVPLDKVDEWQKSIFNKCKMISPDYSPIIDKQEYYSRRYRNRRIGDFLKELHLTEGRNTGFRKILHAIKANGSPLPEFETDEYHDYFVSRFFIHDGFYDGFTDTFVGSDVVEAGNTTIKSYQNETSLQRVLQQVLKQVDYKKLLPIIIHMEMKGRISVQEAMELIGKSRTTVWRYLKMLVDAGVVEVTGETNNSTYVLKAEYVTSTAVTSVSTK